MDSFLPNRYSDDIDPSSGKPYIEWESSFDTIRDKWEEALVLSNRPKRGVELEKLLEIERRQQDNLVPNFIQGIQMAVDKSLQDKNEIKWIDATNNKVTSQSSLIPNIGGLDRGNQVYEQALMEERHELKMLNEQVMEMNNMVRSMSGADKLLGW